MSADTPYDDLVMDHIRNARNYREPRNATSRASGLNPLCGDELAVYVRVAGGIVEEAAFQCTCCGVSMASASVMTEIVTGLRAGAAKELLAAFIIALKAGKPPVGMTPAQQAIINTARRYPVRATCALLPWSTLEAALDNRADTVFVR